MIDVTKNFVGCFVRVTGQYRSYNLPIQDQEHKSKLLLYVFAKEWELLGDEESVFENQIILRGFLCKKPVHRKTPFGRELTELLVAVNRTYANSDYIPCICWGIDSYFASEYEVGTSVELMGRVQSREYSKTLSNGESETRIAYEVSCKHIDKWILSKK